MSSQQNISFEFRASNLFTPVGAYAYGGHRVGIRQALEHAIVFALEHWVTDSKDFFNELTNQLGVKQFTSDSIIGGYIANGYDMVLTVYLDCTVAVRVERLQGLGIMNGMMTGMNTMPGMNVSYMNPGHVYTRNHTHPFGDAPITKGETVPFHFYNLDEKDYYAPNHPLRGAKMYMVLNCLPGLDNEDKKILELIEDYALTVDGQLWPEGVLPLRELENKTSTSAGCLNHVTRESLLKASETNNVIVVVYEDRARVILEPLKSSFNPGNDGAVPSFV